MDSSSRATCIAPRKRTMTLRNHQIFQIPRNQARAGRPSERGLNQNNKIFQCINEITRYRSQALPRSPKHATFAFLGVILSSALRCVEQTRQATLSLRRVRERRAGDRSAPDAVGDVHTRVVYELLDFLEVTAAACRNGLCHAATTASHPFRPIAASQMQCLENRSVGGRSNLGNC